MKLTKIRTRRKIESQYNRQLVHEWEDVMQTELELDFHYETLPFEVLNKIVRKLKLSFNPLQYFYRSSKVQLQFQMYGKTWQEINNRKDIIPIIIDFYVSKENLQKFYNAYSQAPLVLITSSEAFLFLKGNSCPLNIAHFPLSISDKYRISDDAQVTKRWDLAMIGRPNEILDTWTQRYIKDNPNLTYVYRKKEGNKFLHYSNTGEPLGELNDRDSYMKVLSQAKISFYSTPGIDGREHRTNGFNQVTPRFLEMIAAGCHIISRYPKNPDTEFYDLDNITENIRSYEVFKKKMNKYLVEEIPYKKYSNYLKKHYTSERAKVIKKILN